MILVNERDIDTGRIDLSAAGVDPIDMSDPADRAFIESGGLPRRQMMNFLTDLQYEPSWRRKADKAVDYYDNKQLSPELIELMKSRGLPPIQINMIAPTINNILGMEAKTRTDAEVTFDDDESEEVAIALNKKLNDSTREARSDQACSDAYSSQVKAGLGWVEVSRNNNPMQYRYRVQSIHRREIWWDWRDQTQDLRDARYLVRRKWFDDDYIELLLPGYRDMLKGASGFGHIIDGFMTVLDNIGGSNELDGPDVDRGISLEQAEWRDTGRRRSMLYEAWYRTWHRGFVVRLPNDKVVEIDQTNPEHMGAIASGAVQAIPAVWPKMRQSFWVGPMRIYDAWSPCPHEHFPYTPFWGFREDGNGMPYGAIENLIPSQDEINNRRSRMLALLSARRVRIDADALDATHNSHAKVAASASSHNYYVITNPNRKNVDGVHIDTNNDLSVPQLEILRESKQEIQQTSGMFKEQCGQAQAGMSGRAINSLIEAGVTTLAELNDNYRFSRLRVHEQLLDFIKADSMHPHSVIVGEARQRRTILLNQVAPENGEAPINSVKMSNARVILQEVPQTAGYRQQQFMMLSELVKGLPPEITQFVIDYVIEASDLPERKKIANRLRQALNLPSDEGQAGQQPQIPPEIMQQIQALQQENEQGKAVLAQTQEELAKAQGNLRTDSQKHQNRMEELTREEQLARIKHGQQLEQAMGPEVMGVKQLLDAYGADTDRKIGEIITMLQPLVAQMQSQQPTQPIQAIPTQPATGAM